LTVGRFYWYDKYILLREFGKFCLTYRTDWNNRFCLLGSFVYDLVGSNSSNLNIGDFSFYAFCFYEKNMLQKGVKEEIA
jgi:hypothetical protein